MRRSTFQRVGAYDGEALFENLELMRTVRAGGGRVLTPLDLYVARRPPSSSHFRSQRVRQAYDDFAIPARIGGFLALAPLIAALAAGRRWRALAGLGLAPVALAEAGRRRAGGRRHFPASGSAMAPLWLGERALCSWLALGARLRGGVRYGERRIYRSASSTRALSERNPIVL